MKLFSERELIRTVAERWGNLKGMDRKINSKTFLEIHEELQALDVETATIEDVKNVIGNYTWTDITCDECGKIVQAAVQVGEEPDYESKTAMICLPCSLNMLNLLMKEEYLLKEE